MAHSTRSRLSAYQVSRKHNDAGSTVRDPRLATVRLQISPNGAAHRTRCARNLQHLGILGSEPCWIRTNDPLLKSPPEGNEPPCRDTRSARAMYALMVVIRAILPPISLSIESTRSWTAETRSACLTNEGQGASGRVASHVGVTTPSLET